MTLYRADRHEALEPRAWNEAAARATIERIVADADTAFAPDTLWPMHPRDADDAGAAASTPLYFGACGVIWALRYLEKIGAAAPTRSYAEHVRGLLPRNAAWLAAAGMNEPASYLMGETSILMQMFADAPSSDTTRRIETLLAGNLSNPTRELMWGSPGTMLAALFMYERTNEARWADIYSNSARMLWSQLHWSPEHECRYWTQDMYGVRGSYIDAVHGFAGTAAVLIRGRELLDSSAWSEWQRCIDNTIRRSATIEHGLANWRAWLDPPPGKPDGMLMQFCHGAPGFVICLADFPGTSLEDLLLAGGEATWQAGPLRKGANLCHGTGGNGYAFLKLYVRTGDELWLSRARAFAMHAIKQAETDHARYDQRQYSLWTGDLGLAVYLWDCISGAARFPTLDVFFAA